MAPKKKQQKQKSSASSSNKPKPQSSSSTGPKLQISSENEQRLRRLLLNSGRSTTTQIAVAPADESLSREQKAKRLRSVYENLSCEGFLDDQIERALSALKEGATFEAALDWLCLNLPGNELPLKFSTGTSLYGNEGGNVGVLSTAQENWSRPLDSSAKLDVEMPKAIVRTKARANEDTLDSCQPSQAEWIRQYLEQQEEEEPDSWEDDLPGTHSTEKIPKPRDSYDSLIQEYHTARIEAQRAKERGDKKRQQEAGGIIRKLKQEMSILGLSDEILLSGLEGLSNSSMHPEQTETVSSCDEDSIVPIEIEIGSDMNGTSDEVCTTKDFSSAQSPVDGSVQDLVEESEDVELGGLFTEDASSSEAVHSELLNQQKKEKIQSLSSRKNLEKLEGLWKKGDPQRIPKAVLQQLCQKFGWEAPKYEKVPGKENNYIYAVSILRKASGRGKSRKAGGLVTLQLPSQEEAFASAEVSVKN